MGKINLGNKISTLEEDLKLTRICLEQERLKNAGLIERLRMVEIAARGTRETEASDH